MLMSMVRSLILICSSSDTIVCSLSRGTISTPIKKPPLAVSPTLSKLNLKFPLLIDTTMSLLLIANPFFIADVMENRLHQSSGTTFTSNVHCWSSPFVCLMVQGSRPFFVAIMYLPLPTLICSLMVCALINPLSLFVMWLVAPVSPTHVSLVNLFDSLVAINTTSSCAIVSLISHVLDLCLYFSTSWQQCFLTS